MLTIYLPQQLQKKYIDRGKKKDTLYIQTFSINNSELSRHSKIESFPCFNQLNDGTLRHSENTFKAQASLRLAGTHPVHTSKV